MAEVIKTDGIRQEITPREGKRFKLEELQAIVGGFIEIVALPGRRIMVLNEEGKLKQLPSNAAATALARGTIAGSDFIVGDVLVCLSKEVS
ncbi:MAG: DUF3846 domain-containing protein [Chloroflexi bacterium]|nr:DUF3846 domain-containing protein [Chloroflexota bacterium]